MQTRSPMPAVEQCHTVLAAFSLTWPLRKTAWTAKDASRSALSAWKSSNPARRWAGWNVSASSTANAFETGGASKAVAAVRCTFSTSECGELIEDSACGALSYETHGVDHDISSRSFSYGVLGKSTAASTDLLLRFFLRFLGFLASERLQA